MIFSNIVFGLIAVVVLQVIHGYLRDRKLPPGPPRLPFIGNLHQAPTKGAPWLTYDKLLKQYGPLISLKIFGATIIVIGDYGIARDLLDKRGNIYSDRPRLVMAGENLTKGMHLLLRRYDERYVLHQRLAAPVLSPRASNCYIPLQDLESKQMLYNLLSTNDHSTQFLRFSGSIVYALTYGFRLITGKEQQVEDAHRVVQNFSHAAMPGAWIVDAIPVLNYLPTALAPWKKTAEEFYQIESSLHMRNFKGALERKGWNWTKDFKNAKETETMPDIELAYSLGILADAGVDTTTALLPTFILACLMHPGLLPKAQKELDNVVGDGRLPVLKDLEKLPYVSAVVEETFRWRHIAPGGVPHATTQEDSYNGYRIPKGSTVLPIFWSMRMNEDAYDNSHQFRPERWLDKAGQPNNFGYGRRVCTGRFIAKNSVSLVISRLLWAFNIRHQTDEELDDMAFTSGFVSTPLPFSATFEPRSPMHKEVIEQEFDAVEKDVSVVLDRIRNNMIGIGLTPRA